MTEKDVSNNHSRPLGSTLPLNNVHAVSVSLPTWEDTEGWASRDPAVLKVMKTGYPRFFIHRMVISLGERIIQRFGARLLDPQQPRDRLSAVLFCSERHALQCEHYLEAKASKLESRSVSRATLADRKFDISVHKDISWEHAELHVVIYPESLFRHAKDFWQHTGSGISSRYAEYCLSRYDHLTLQSTAGKRLGIRSPAVDTNGTLPDLGDTDIAIKQRLRTRIANLTSSSQNQVCAKDVYLFPTGMSAISKIAEMLRGLAGTFKKLTVVVYGFLYLDTFKVLSKVYQFEIILLGHSSAGELDELESRLQDGLEISALFCESPGNPLLRSPDIARIRHLADEFNFATICDDTVGTCINVDVLPQVDILMTSLTKIFSGACDVMGGSLVLNSRRRHYTSLCTSLRRDWQDTYYPPDAAIMEKNSRDFAKRMEIVNANTAAIYKKLKSHPLVSKVYYPKDSSTQGLYDSFAKTYRNPQNGKEEIGYGYLLSLTFPRPAQAVAFYDALDVAKGPSLGTNFTLACAYTLFAHYNERDWAASYGVEEFLVRISVGIEQISDLIDKIEGALQAAEAA